MPLDLDLAGAAVVPDAPFAAGPVDPAWRTAQRRRRWGRRMLPLAGAALLLLAWGGVVAWWQVRPFIAPSPLVVAAVLYGRFGTMMANLLPTATEAVCGFLLGNALAVLTATAFVHARRLQDAFFPIAVLVNSIPVVAKAPILVLLLGNGMSPKVAIAAVICFFPTLVTMVRGLQAVSPQAMELMHVLSATRWQVFTRLRLPTAVPYLFSSLKIATSTATVGAIVGEWIGSQSGIGALIIQATYNFDSALLYATVLCGSCFSVAFFLLVAGAERLAVRWSPPGSGA